jgi:hypothetical protein
VPIRPRISRVMPWAQGVLTCVSCMLMTILALTASTAYGTNDRDACPPPFIFAGLDQPDKHTRCILPRDATIGATLLIDTSQITLDCKGHPLRPAQPGVADDPATADDETVYASPMVAFLVDGAHGVTLQDCLVDGFDFGIHARNSKRPAGPAADRLGNKILSNTFHTRYSGICLLDVDDMQIIDNDITATSASATPIFLWRDSDRNLVKNNRIVINAEGVTF